MEIDTNLGFSKIKSTLNKVNGTIIKPNRIVGNTDIEYYPYAKETLQLISNRSDLDLNIYTCSHDHEVIEYQNKFKEDGIIFKYVNENQDAKTINISIEGDINKLDVNNTKKIEITGNVNEVNTASGNLKIGGDVFNSISTKSGDINNN